jgi:uncharacterized protein DUF1707
MLPDHIRVGDQDRSDAIDRLGAHAAAGRLTVGELEHRVDRAHAAVYARDLRAIESDLPGPRQRRSLTRWHAPVPVRVLAVVVLVTAIAASVVVRHAAIVLFFVAMFVWRRVAYAAGRSTRARAS